jgi:hypothetical protein
MLTTPPDPTRAASAAAVLTDLSEIDQLADAIATLAARLHAATYELLVLLREFDQRAGWNDGFLSCAHWLHWRTGIDLGAAREKVRVARALADLPRISAAMQRGQLSYAKVRALSRIASAANESELLDVARAGSAAHVERLVRAWRRVDRIEAAEQTERRQLERQVTTWVDEDGMLVIRGRLTPEAGAVVQRALEAAADQLYKESAGAATGDRCVDEVTVAQRRADALARVAEWALAGGLDRGTAGDRYQVVVHVDAATLQADSNDGADDGHAVVEMGDSGTWVSAETAQRLACDASVVVMRHGSDGAVLDVGRKTRTIPPPIRRALVARDTHCQYPGCTARRCDAHHLTPWAVGGHTRLDGLCLLCRRHHTVVHEQGYRVIREIDGAFTFIRPDGNRLDAVSPPPRWTGTDRDPLHPTSMRLASAGISIGPHTATPHWSGERFDVGWAIAVLRGRST